MGSQNRGPQVSGVASFFLALSTIAIVLRAYCRVCVVKNFGYDDWFAIIAWLFFVFFCAFAITGVQHGTGQHASALLPSEIFVGIKWWWACEPVYVLSNMALKLSIGIFLLRIAVCRLHRMIIYVVLGILELYCAFFFFLFVLQCRPSSYFWTRYTGGEGTCIDASVTVNATYAYSAISCVADWTLGILPIFMVWNLKMNTRTKWSVAAILAMGAIASTVTIIRIPYVKDLANQADFLYATTDVAIWSTSETGIGIAASSLATLRPLFRNFFRSRSTRLGTTEPGPSNNWPNNEARAGYVRSGSKEEGDGVQAFRMRDDIGKNQGVRTVIASRQDTEAEASNDKDSGGKRCCYWNRGESKLRESSSDEESGRGITKTMDVTTIAD